MTDSMTTESRSEERVLNFERLRIAKLKTEPFDYILASGIIRADWTDRLISDYPSIRKAGSFPLSALRCGADFSRLIHALDGREFREIVEEKFSIQLGGRPTMFTVRGYCRLKDGKIHTDTESKIITVLLYMIGHGRLPAGGCDSYAARRIWMMWPSRSRQTSAQCWSFGAAITRSTGTCP